MRERNKTLTELSRSPFPSVSYSRNMTGGKQENRVSMMTQIMSNDQLFGAQTFTPWLPLEGHNVFCRDQSQIWASWFYTSIAVDTLPTNTHTLVCPPASPSLVGRGNRLCPSERPPGAVAGGGCCGGMDSYGATNVSQTGSSLKEAVENTITKLKKHIQESFRFFPPSTARQLLKSSLTTHSRF